jgi:hypothetical protein
MSSIDQFWEYAKEALLLASSAKSYDDKENLLELAQTWMRAASAAALTQEITPGDAPTANGWGIANG